MRPTQSAWSSWVSKAIWRERVLTFDPSWFLVTMGTGITFQLHAASFPFPSVWLYHIGYSFWVLDVVLFTFFTAMGITRMIMFPRVCLALLDDIAMTSYLGAIPVSLDTVGFGIMVFYASQHEVANIIAQILFWFSTAMSFAVTCGGAYVLSVRQDAQELSSVTGSLLLIFNPMLVTAAFGSNLATHLSPGYDSAVLLISLMMVSLGGGLTMIVLGIYVWRLLHCQLPPRDAIISTFVPAGPPSMAGYTIANLGVSFAKVIIEERFTFNGIVWNGQLSMESRVAIAHGLIWMGIFASFFLLGVATFFLVEAVFALLTKVPKHFNIGLWSFVFPIGAYFNAFCRLSTLLRADGLKLWGVIGVVITVALWLGCALATFYKGVIRGQLFFAPGLVGWVEEEHFKAGNKMQPNTGATQAPASSSGSFVEGANADGSFMKRRPRNDGTYTTPKPKGSWASDTEDVISAA